MPKKIFNLFLVLSLVMLISVSKLSFSKEQKYEVEEIVQKLDSLMYYPQEHGLKDLQTDVYIEHYLPKNPLLPNALKAKFYWKEPYRITLKLVDMEKFEKNSTLQPLLENIRLTLIDIARLLVLEKKKNYLKRYDFIPSEDGKLVKMTLVAKENYKNKLRVEDVAFWLDSTPIYAKWERKENDGTVSVSWDFTYYVTPDGKHLPQSISTNANLPILGKREAKVFYFYKKVKNILLLSEILYTSLEGEVLAKIVFTNHQVNEGINDKVFANWAFPE